MTKFNSFEKYTISSKPVVVNYIHAGVFVPVFKKENERFTFNPLGNNATKIAYWDEEAYVSELIVSMPIEEKAKQTSETRVKSASDKAAAAAEKEGLVAPGKETEAKAKKRKTEANASAKSKKVRFCPWKSMWVGLIVPDCSCPSAILEQSSCRVTWC